MTGATSAKFLTGRTQTGPLTKSLQSADAVTPLIQPCPPQSCTYLSRPYRLSLARVRGSIFFGRYGCRPWARRILTLRARSQRYPWESPELRETYNTGQTEMKFLSLIAIAVALVLGCGQDPSQEDSVPTARVQQLPAPAPTAAPAPEPPAPVPPTAAPPPSPTPTLVPVPTQPSAAPSATPPAPAGRITQPTESWLSEAIQSVPPDYSLTYLRFANYEAARIIGGRREL